MKLHLDPATAKNTITGYGEGYVMVNRQRFERSLVVLPERLLLDWPPSRFDELAPDAPSAEERSRLRSRAMIRSTRAVPRS